MALIWLLLRAVPRIQPHTLPPQIPSSDPNIPASHDAVLLIAPGGRVLYTNPIAREWFNYTRLDDEPNLERLARRARPSDVFWGLCNGNAQGRFSLDGRIVEGASYHLPFGGLDEVNRVVVVTLRRPQVTAIASEESQFSDQALNIFAELTQEMAANLDLEATLAAILEGVERLIQSDFPEVTVWDADKQELIPYRFVGVNGVDRRLEKAADRYYPEKGYAGYLITRREPLLIGNVDTYRVVRPTVNRKQYPFNSYLGIPLLFAGELMGTLELASLSQNAFSENDLQVLRILSGQASIALHNALLFRDEQRRVRELSGLAKLAHAVSASNDTQNLFSRLVESIRPLLDVKILGFLTYDESRRLLAAQPPFVGLPPQLVEIYRVSIAPNSPAEGILFSQETIIAPNAPENRQLNDLGVTHLAQAASIVSTVFVPLNSAGRFLGYLQVADKSEGASFDQDDLRLLEIIAVQAATIIENATLVVETQERAQRAESLRRIASLTGSAATLDEILQFSLRELARLLQADMAAIFLLDEARGELRLHRDSLFGAELDIAIRVGRIAMSSPDFRLTATGRRRPHFITNLADDTQLPAFYHAISEIFSIQSFMAVPLIVRDQGMGEILLGSQSAEFFDRSELIMVSTIGSQLAAAIERSSLYTQTDDSLRRRVEQLTAFTRISREISATLELKRLLQLVYDELLRTTQANCGTILLFDLSASNEPRIAFSVGDEPGATLSPIERYVAENDEAVIVQDFSQPQELFDHAVLAPPHHGIFSCLVAPIAYQENVAGLIALHGRLPNRFDDTSLEIAQTLALQAAIAFGNAQRYHEQLQRSELLNRRVETLARLLEASQSLHVDAPLEQSLETIAYGIQESTPFDIVLISIFDAEKQQYERLIGVGMPLDALNELRSYSQPKEAIDNLLRPVFRFSHSYYIPHDNRPAEIANLHSMTLMPGIMPGVEDERAWHPNDFLLVPMLASDGRPLGLISVDSPRNGLRPDRPTIESLEIFTSQATFITESFQKLQELKFTAAAVQQDMERMHMSVAAQQAYLPTLLHKDVEQTIAIQRLNQSVRRVRAGLDIAEIVNRQPNRSNALLALGQEILTHIVEMDVALVAEPATGGTRLLHMLGEIPANVNPEVLVGQRNPLRQSLQTGQPVMVPNLDESEWQNSPLLMALEAKSFLCLPIVLESGVDSAVLAISRTPLPVFTLEDEQLYALLIRQISITLENLRLLMQTNRRLQEVNLLLEFSRQMGSLETKSILQTLVDSALQVVPAAHAAMVALWRTDEGCLVPQVASGYVDNQRILQITYRPGEALPGLAFQQGQPLRVDDVDFARQYNLSSQNVMHYRDAVEGRLPVSNLIIPIQTLDNKLGVMVLDNFKTPAAFTEDDQALVFSLARQTALALENARLFQASEQRTAQLQALTNVAATITSSLQTDELIASLLDQVKAILPYETGTLWLRQVGQMTIRAARGFEDSDQRIGLSVAVEDSLLLKEMITTSRPISVGDVREDVRFPSLVEPRYFSWLGVPLLSKGEVVGVIALEKGEANFYTPEHIQAMITFAGQAAVALENAALFEESARRTLEMDRRSQRLALLNRLSTELSGSLDPVHILRMATQELSRAINCTAVSALLSENGDRVSVQAEVPATTPTLPLALPKAPIFTRLSETQGVFSTEDISTEPDLAPLIGYLSIRKTRALLVLPLVTGGEFHGLLLAHADRAYRFTPDEVELARTISNQAAVAVQNARLFAETQRLFAETELRSAELTTLYELGVNFSEVLDTRRLMDIAFDKLLRLVKADAVMLVMLDAEEDSLVINAIDQGERIGPVKQLRSGNSFSEHVLDVGHPLLIADAQDRESLPVAGQNIGSPVRCWLGAPLIVRGVAVGVISLQSYKPNVFSDAEQRLLVQVANQLAVSLDNARLFASAQHYAADLEQRVSERTEQVEAEHRRTQTLLGIITELSSSLDMDLVLNRTLKVINDTVGSEHSLIMLVNPDQATLQLRASLGYTTSPVPKGGQQSWIRPNEGLAGWVIKNRQSALVGDLWNDPRWLRRDNATEQHRSSIAVPLVMGEETLGALLLFHRESDYFTMDQLELAQGAAKQIAVAINNAQLFRLIRDQAEHLGDMLRTQHIETSRSHAILEAVADGVLVTDANRKITLFNASAEKILGLDRGQVLGQSLEHFIGLFGKAAQTWSQTIQLWSDDPASYQAGDTYAEQIELDNNRVVSVALSPVRLRSDFLGTVSIFRDITHMVEVDRLKSEFVATVSHELRTPMTSIKGYVEIMLMGATGALSEQQTHFLKVVKANTERLAILVNDLLDISRIEAGRSTLSWQPLELDKIVGESIAALARRSQEEGRPMSFEMIIPPDLPHAYGDLERVRQIVDNLLENGYQYTPDNGRVTLSAHLECDEIQVDVADNGIGIPAEEQPRVFDRFYRGEDPLVLATSGTGLGLSIVQHLVEMHKGRIWMESSGIRGEGSKFSFTLPVYNPENHNQEG